MAVQLRPKRKPIAEINVVPYIDVMLVLLIVFMVTAPMLERGVKVELPQVSAEPLQMQQQDLITVWVKADGGYHLSIGDKNEEKSLEDITDRIVKTVKGAPATPVFVEGDHQVPYGKVVALMARLQGAGVQQVGLVTEPAQ